MTSRHNGIKKTIAAFGMVAGAMAVTADAKAADPIKIGTFLSVTGPASFLGDPELKTLELYIKDLNKKTAVF